VIEVDDRHRAPLGRPLRQHLPAHERDLHRPQVTRRHEAVGRAQRRAVGRPGAVVPQEDERVAARSVERQRADAARIHDAGERGNPLDELVPPLEQAGAEVVAEARDVELHGHGEHLCRVEAGVGASELEEAARHETGANHEDDGERYLATTSASRSRRPPPAVPRVRMTIVRPRMAGSLPNRTVHMRSLITAFGSACRRSSFVRVRPIRVAGFSRPVRVTVGH
jgi:hypothetical protein